MMYSLLVDTNYPKPIRTILEVAADVICKYDELVRANDALKDAAADEFGEVWFEILDIACEQGYDLMATPDYYLEEALRSAKNVYIQVIRAEVHGR